MSEIDSYKYECIGIVGCPSSYWPPFVTDTYPVEEGGEVLLYLLPEDTLEANSFQAKRGDLLLGGGSGESPALRISMPETLIFYTRADYEDIIVIDGSESGRNVQERLHHAYWSMTHAFIFGDGYAKLGWNPKESPMENWLVHHILAFVHREYPELWSDEWGPEELHENGSICRTPTAEERALLKPSTYRP